VVWLNGKEQRAHRVILRELHVPIAGMEVRHLCHNKRCINPDHLTVGTHQENMADSAAINTMDHKLTLEEVDEIRRDSRPQQAIADDYGLNQSNVSRIKSGDRRKQTTP